jgi:hypothetical protein
MQKLEDLKMDLRRDSEEGDFLLGEGLPGIAWDWDTRGTTFGFWMAGRHGSDV